MSPISGRPAAGRTEAQQDTQKFAEAAIADSKREGLLLAVRARWVALAVIAVTLPIINPNWDVIYYIVMLGLFALIGWAQLKVGKVGRSQPELFLIFCDLALMTLLTVVPNPFSAENWPLGMQFRFETFIYFFVFLATATLAYSWRTVVAMGFWTSAVWAIGVGWAYLQPETHAELSERVRAAVGSDVRMFDIINPAAIGIPARFQEITVFLIVAMTLALAVRRSNALLISHAGIERERANLARYFSPNVVEQLSGNDEPLKQVRHAECCGAVRRHRRFHRLCRWPRPDGGHRDAAAIPRADGTRGVPARRNAGQVSRRRIDGDVRHALRQRFGRRNALALRAGHDRLDRASSIANGKIAASRRSGSASGCTMVKSCSGISA